MPLRLEAIQSLVGDQGLITEHDDDGPQFAAGEGAHPGGDGAAHTAGPAGVVDDFRVHGAQGLATGCIDGTENDSDGAEAGVEGFLCRTADEGLAQP